MRNLSLTFPFRGYIRRLLHFQGVSDVNKTEIYLCVLASIDGIILPYLIFVMQVVVSFEPLHKLQVVLVPALAQFFDIDVFLYFALGEGLLEDLVVVDELPLVPGVPVYALHGCLAWKHGVDYVAVNGPGAQLLDLGDFEREGGVDPV